MDEVISVPRDEATTFFRRPGELLGIRESLGIHLVGADGIHAPPAQQLSDTLAEVLIQVVPHRGPAARVGCSFARRSRVHFSFRAIWRVISSG